MIDGLASTLHPALQTDAVASRLAKRYLVERIFRAACLGALCLALGFLAVLFVSIISKGYTAYSQTQIALEIFFEPEILDPAGTRDPEALASANYNLLVRTALAKRFPEVSGRRERRQLAALISNGAAFDLQAMVQADPALIGTRATIWLPAADDADMLIKGHIPRHVPETERRVSDQTDRLARPARSDRPGDAPLQSPLLHLRRLARARAGRRLGRGQRVLLHPPGDTAAVVSSGPGGCHLPGGVRSSKPLDRPDRGQHQQSSCRTLDRLRAFRAWPSFSTS